MKDVLLVGFDADTFQGYEQLIQDHQIHIGISILDTRHLNDILVSPTAAKGPRQVIESYQFTLGNSKYCHRAANKFLFGDSKPAASIKDLRSGLEALVGDRDAILVMHGADSDLKMLRNLGVNLRPRYIIDTNKAAQHPLQLSYRYCLETLLEALEIPYASLHAAGNDARFALQALLMIAVRDAERLADTSDCAVLELLRAIAQAPRPPTAGETKEDFDAVRREAKAEMKARHKAKRASRTERRRLEREAREDGTYLLEASTQWGY